MRSGARPCGRAGDGRRGGSERRRRDGDRRQRRGGVGEAGGHVLEAQLDCLAVAFDLEPFAGGDLAVALSQSGALLIVDAVADVVAPPRDAEHAAGGDDVVDQLLGYGDVGLAGDRWFGAVDLLEVVGARGGDVRLPRGPLACDLDEAAVAQGGGADAMGHAGLTPSGHPSAIHRRMSTCCSVSVVRCDMPGVIPGSHGRRSRGWARPAKRAGWTGRLQS